jgi:hypothetical protein
MQQRARWGGVGWGGSLRRRKRIRTKKDSEYDYAAAGQGWVGGWGWEGWAMIFTCPRQYVSVGAAATGVATGHRRRRPNIKKAAAAAAAAGGGGG